MIKSAFAILAVASTGVLAHGGKPDDVVATVDGQAIVQRDFDHWMTVASRSAGSVVLDPATGYRHCIAAKRRQIPAKDRRKVSDKALATECRQDYAGMRAQVEQLLISFKWIEGEAAAQSVTVTDAEVAQSFQDQKQQSFPRDADFQKFLTQSGQTKQDILQRVRLDLLSNKIRDKVVAGKDQVSDQAIAQFYADHRSQFAEPEKRSLRLVLTKHKAQAEAARAALERGTSWQAVAKRYSIDEHVQERRRQAPRPGEGHAGPRDRQGGLRGRQAPPGRPDPLGVRLPRLLGHQGHPGAPADARGGQRDDQGNARQRRRSRRRSTPSCRTSRRAGAPRPNARRATGRPTAATARRRPPRRPRHHSASVPTMRAAVVLTLVIAIAGGAFLAGRATARSRAAPAAAARPHPGSYDDGYDAGWEDAFSGYDGGWVLGDPYVVTLRRGGPGLTYRFARRWPLLPGREYRSCDQDIICSRPTQ